MRYNKSLWAGSDWRALVDVQKASPFFSYHGGKRRFAEWIVSHFPHGIDTYYEPFVGGGAVFWDARKNNLANKYTISDVSPIVYCHYTTLRDDFDSLVALCEQHSSKHSYDYFYVARDKLRELTKNGVYTSETSALDIYNRQTSLYCGGNTPKGYGAYPFNVHLEKLSVCSHLLQNVDIKMVGYHETNPSSGDLVYCDPPYTGTRQYHYAAHLNRGERKFWDSDSDNGLCEFAKMWAESGASVLISGVVYDEPLEDGISSHTICRNLKGWDVKSREFYHKVGRIKNEDRPLTREILVIGRGKDGID